MHIESYANVILACRFCFMCRHLSAVGNVTCRECDTPRGRALIADTVRMRPEFLANADFVKTIYDADLAGANRFHCVNHYDEVGLVLALRRDIVETGHAPAEVAALAAKLAATSSWTTEGKGDVLFFLDPCTARTPEIAAAFLKLAGPVRVIRGGCIGKALATLGYAAEAVKAAADFAAVVKRSGAKTLVVSNPAAMDALTRDFPLKDVQVMHSAAYLAGLGLKPHKQAGRVACIESDFLKNYLQDANAPRKLVASLGAELVPIGTNAEESYSAGEGAVVLDTLNPTLVAGLAAAVKARIPTGTRAVTASPYTRRVLAQAGVDVVTIEEFAAEVLC